MPTQKESLVHWTKRFATGKLSRSEWERQNFMMEDLLHLYPVSAKRKQRARNNMWKVYQKTWGGVGKDVRAYKKKLGRK
jgi:hypothetical protein